MTLFLNPDSFSRMPRSTLIMIIGLLCWLSLVGCASFPSSGLTKYTYEQILQQEERVGLDFEAKAITIDMDGKERIASERKFQKQIENVFSKSNMFSLARENTELVKYHFILSLRSKNINYKIIPFSLCEDVIWNEKRKPSDSAKDRFIDLFVVDPALYMFCYGLVLSLFPQQWNEEYILESVVKKHEQVLQVYQYKRHLNTWGHISLVFMMPTHSPGKVWKELVDNMLLNFLHDLQRDKILEVKTNEHPGES